QAVASARGRDHEEPPGVRVDHEHGPVRVLTVAHPDHAPKVRSHLDALVVGTTPDALAPDSSGQLHDSATSLSTSTDSCGGNACPRVASQVRCRRSRSAGPSSSWPPIWPPR